MFPTTLFLLEAATVGCCSMLLFIAREPGRQLDPISLWATGMIVATGGLLLLVSPLPRVMSHDMAIAFVLAAGGIGWSGARRFAHQPVRPLLSLAGAAVWLVLQQFPSFEDPALDMALSWGIGAVYSFTSMVALWPDGSERLPARPAMLILIGIHGTLYLARAIIALLGLDAPFRHTFSSVLILEAQFRVIGTSFLAIALTKQRGDIAVARSLQAANQAVEARRRFLAHMSHEIRTPLNGVLGLAQVLGNDTRLLPDQRHHVKALEAAGRHLMSIVNDVLDLAKIDAGRLDFVGRPLDLQEAVEGCLALARPAATDKAIDLDLVYAPELAPIVIGDRTRLQQILLNLLWNALKFTPVGGSVTLHIAPLPGGVRFEVTDTGPGIPEDRRHLLFQDFSQLEPGASEGSGLGLAISARLAGQMEGNLSYHPGPDGAGSIFRLDLPWPAAAPADPPPLPARADENPGLRLLIVDDVRANRLLLRALLSAQYPAIADAGGGEAALRHAMSHPVDAVLLDLRMPGLSGFEVARRLRAQQHGDRLAIIAVSGDVMPETVSACHEAGMDDVIAKPVDRAVLLAALDRAVALRHSAGKAITAD